jgi:endo-1,4-beta-xylanase
MTGDLYQTNPAWNEILLKDFNSVTIDRGLYWPGNTENPNAPFDSSVVDPQVAYALSQGMRVRGHPLLYPTNPALQGGWSQDGNFSSADLSQIITHHVSEVVSHYQGVVKEWVVVNEAYKPGHMTYLFFRILGPNYIDLAFAAARRADPTAVLLYNDGDNETSRGLTTAATRAIVARLKAKGLIDGVGLQMHLGGNDPPQKADVIATMRSFGVPVYVTEFDVNLGEVGGDQTQRFAIQAEIYRNMLQACLESGVCKGFTFWGVGDRYSWLETRLDAVPNADPTLFDNQLQPKPAYFAVRDVLRAWSQTPVPTP